MLLLLLPLLLYVPAAAVCSRCCMLYCRPPHLLGGQYLSIIGHLARSCGVSLWSVVSLHNPLQLCVGLGSVCILAGVGCVTASTGMDVQEIQLEELRTVSTLEQRLLSGRIAPLDNLARMASLPNLRLGRRSTNASSLMGASPDVSVRAGVYSAAVGTRAHGNTSSGGGQDRSLPRTLTATF